MTRYKLIDILPENITNQFDFAASYTPPGAESPVSFTIFSSALFVQELEQHFTDRIIRLGDTTPTSDLLALFGRWKNSRSDSYARRAYALSVKYEPLENYDRIEHKEGKSDLTHGESITRTHADTDTRTHADTDTETHTADTVTRSYTNYNEENKRSGSETDARGVFGVNSASNTPVPSDTDTRTYNDVTDSKDITGSYSDAHTGSVANAHTGTITDAHTGTITDAHTGKDSTEDNYDLRAHGNIGIKGPGEMLSEDMDILKYDLALVAICDFIDRYTFYSEGLDL